LKAGLVVEKIWHDPVWSKVIAAGIIAFAAWIGGHYFGLWSLLATTWPIPRWLLGLLVLLNLTLITVLLYFYQPRKAPTSQTSPEPREEGKSEEELKQTALTMLAALDKLDRDGRVLLEHMVTVGEELEQSSIHVASLPKRYLIDVALSNCQKVGFLKERRVKQGPDTFFHSPPTVSYWSVFDVWKPVLKKIFPTKSAAPIQITHPRPGEMLTDPQPLGSDSVSYIVRGKLKSLPEEHSIWLLTQDERSGQVWPQGFYPVQFDEQTGEWHGRVNVLGRSLLRLYAVVAPPTSQDLFRYFQKRGDETRHFVPLNRVPPECRNIHSVQARVP
jgi:hypothetical protein